MNNRSIIDFPRSDGRDRPFAPERLIPQSLEAEQSTLGASMLEAEALSIARRLLQRDDFYRENHRLIFDALCELADTSQPIDVVTLAEELRRRGQLDRAGGIPYVGVLMEACPSTANVESYARVVAARSRERQAVALAESVSSMLMNPATQESRESILANAIAQLQGIQQAASREREGDQAPTISARELMRKTFEPPRWVVPDLICEGLTILAGAPKLGKSWMVLDIALAVSQGGVALGRVPVEQGDVLYLALEDQQQRLQNRLGKYLQPGEPGEEVPERLDFATEWAEQDAGGLDLLEGWLKRHSEARLVIIDTLEKFRPQRTSNANAYADDYRVLGALKRLADKYHVGVVLVHHVAKAQYDDPLMSVSGSLGQAGSADATLVLSRKRSRTSERAVLPGTLFVTGRDMAEAQLAIDFDERTSAWTLQDEGEAGGASRETTDTLKLFLEANESLRSSDVAEVMGISKGTARQRFWRLKNEGLIDAESPGVYRITMKGEGLAKGLDALRADAWDDSESVTVTASHLGARDSFAPPGNACNGNAVTPVTTSPPRPDVRRVVNPPAFEPYHAPHDGHQADPFDDWPRGEMDLEGERLPEGGDDA